MANKEKIRQGEERHKCTGFSSVTEMALLAAQSQAGVRKRNRTAICKTFVQKSNALLRFPRKIS